MNPDMRMMNVRYCFMNPDMRTMHLNLFHDSGTNQKLNRMRIRYRRSKPRSFHTENIACGQTNPIG
jgi:hypothetical protein